jgi:GNAT superfamily N-acetyltransferase
LFDNFLLNNCTFSIYNQEKLDNCKFFDCENKDLNDFFSKDSPLYNLELLGKTYCFTLDSSPETIVCAFSVSNDSVKTTFLTNSGKRRLIKDIPRPKQMRSYPAVLIGRLGVNLDFAGRGIGNELMDFIKAWFVDSGNKTGCRFIVVDSYNSPRPINYYMKNGFKFLFNTEEEEKEYLKIKGVSPLLTRLMYFDLILLKT